MHCKAFKNKGFTLIELVVVLSLFMIIVGVTVTMFISIVRHQRTILARQEMLNQISYMQEYVSRGVRAAALDSAGSCLFDETISYPGHIYLLTRWNAAVEAYEGIKFITKDNICQEFFFDRTDNILKEKKDDNPAQDILSSKFSVAFMKFIINGDRLLYGAAGTDLVQPRVTFVLGVQDFTGEGPQEKIYQTTVSRRNLNINE